MTSARPVPATPLLPDRRGHSLIELMVAMTVAGAVLTTAITGMSRLFRLQAGEMQSLSESSVWRRMSHDFREDVHRAVQLDASDGVRLIIHADNGQILWEDTGAVIARTQTFEDGSGMLREHYRLASASVRFSTDAGPVDAESSPNRPVARMMIRQSAESGGYPAAVRLEAVAGLSRRFLSSAQAGEAQ